MFSQEFYKEIQELKNVHVREVYLLRGKFDDESVRLRKYHTRGYNLLNKYGVKIEDYDRVLLAQGGGCKKCGKVSDRSLFPRCKNGTKDLVEIVCLKCLRTLACF